MLSNLTYPEAVKSIYETVNGAPISSDEDLKLVINLLAETTEELQGTRITPELLDEQLAAGVAKGYTIEYQLSLIPMILNR